MTEASTITRESSEQDADRRMLIDGALVDTPRTFPSINPATEEVVGHAPDATVADAEAAVAAARRAFDTTDWSTNTELRIRCLDQLHQALCRPSRRARRADHRRGRRDARDVRGRPTRRADRDRARTTRTC